MVTRIFSHPSSSFNLRCFCLPILYEQEIQKILPYQEEVKPYTKTVTSGIDSYAPREQLMETSRKHTTNVSEIESQQMQVVKEYIPQLRQRNKL